MSDSNDQVAFLAPDPAELNELFPGYEIQSLIATGGMGAVYCAVQKSLDRTVALKILPHEFSKDAAFCEGFEAEAKAMARLNHPNLIGVYDFGEVGGMLFIIMEFVPGKSVYHSAHGQAIDPGEVIRLVTGVCNGLAHAHENGIIHRDIKPSNILLDLNAQPKIGDFGLARPIERKIQEGEEIFGTPHYTAPEVVNAPQSVDYRADIFSVGVMLHELLTGKLPADDTRPPSAISRCDPRFDNIVRRATNPSPAARYASAADMAKDLSLIAASNTARVVRPAGAAAMGPNGPRVAGPIRPRQQVKVKKSSHSSSLVMILLLGAIGYGAFLFFSKPPKTPPPTPATPSQGVPEKTEQSSDAEPKPADPSTDAANETPSGITPDPTPMPSAGISSEPAVEPAPTPESTAPTEPRFDVPAFFQRARKIMQDKAKFQISDRESSLKGNLSEFGRALKRQVRKVDKNKDLVENRLEKFLEKLTEQGATLPTEVDENLVDIPGAEETFTEYLDKQTAIEEAFQKSLFTLSGTYILGLEKQIERLKADKDDAAIKPIEDEIRLTKEEPKHFADLILGTESQN